jgi:hypothetical protein
LLLALVNAQFPFAASQLPTTHAFPVAQALAGPGWQTPPPQVSPTVQGKPSVHGTPLLALWTQP